jgi:hypothetical protein
MKKIYLLSIIIIVISSCTASQSPINTVDYNTLDPIGDLIKKDSITKNFIYGFKQDLEAHNWAYVLSYFDKENFKTQQKIGVDTIQYIAEGMGLNYIDNKLEPRENDPGKYSMLNNMIFLDYRGFKKDDNVFTIYGYVKMYTGGDKRFEMRCVKAGDKMIIIPPVG